MGVSEFFQMTFLYSIVLIMVLIIIVYKLNVKFTIIRKRRIGKNIFSPKRDVLIQRVIITLILTSFFITLVNTQRDEVKVLSDDQSNIDIEKLNLRFKDSNFELFGLQDPVFYYIQNFIIGEIEKHPENLLQSLEDMEASMYIIRLLEDQLTNTTEEHKQERMDLYNNYGRIVLETVFGLLDENRFFYKSIGKTIFVAELLDHFNYLDLTGTELKDFLLKDSNTMVGEDLLNLTLREMFRKELLMEIDENSISFVPSNERYEPAISHALGIGLLELRDFEIPENGIGYQDYLNSKKEKLRVNASQIQTRSYSFKRLNNSVKTILGNNTIEYNIPTLRDYFSNEELHYLSENEKKGLLDVSVPYYWEIQVNNEIPDLFFTPLLTELNLVYWSNMTITNKTFVSATYEMKEDENGELGYELINSTQFFYYYMESEGHWERKDNKWIYHNMTNGNWVWNSTTLNSYGLNTVNPLFYYNVSIRSEDNLQYYLENIVTDPKGDLITGKMYSTGKNQSLTFSVDQNIFKKDFISVANESESESFFSRLIELNNKYYYFPEMSFLNISELQFDIDTNGTLIVPLGAIEITNETLVVDYISSVNETELVEEWENVPINYTLNIYYPELALGPLYLEDEKYLTMFKDNNEDWDIFTFNFANNKINEPEKWNQYRNYYSTGLDDYYDSPSTQILFMRETNEILNRNIDKYLFDRGEEFNVSLKQELLNISLNRYTNGNIVTIYDEIERNYIDQYNWRKIDGISNYDFKTSELIDILELINNIFSVVFDEKLLDEIFNESVLNQIKENIFSRYNYSSGIIDNQLSNTIFAYKILNTLSSRINGIFTQDALTLLNFTLRNYAKLEIMNNREFKLYLSELEGEYDIKEMRMIFDLLQIISKIISQNEIKDAQTILEILDTSLYHPNGKIVLQEISDLKEQIEKETQVAYMTIEEIQILKKTEPELADKYEELRQKENEKISEIANLKIFFEELKNDPEIQLLLQLNGISNEDYINYIENPESKNLPEIDIPIIQSLKTLESKNNKINLDLNSDIDALYNTKWLQNQSKIKIGDISIDSKISLLYLLLITFVYLFDYQNAKSKHLAFNLFVILMLLLQAVSIGLVFDPSVDLQKIVANLSNNFVKFLETQLVDLSLTKGFVPQFIVNIYSTILSSITSRKNTANEQYQSEKQKYYEQFHYFKINNDIIPNSIIEKTNNNEIKTDEEIIPFISYKEWIVTEWRKIKQEKIEKLTDEIRNQKQEIWSLNIKKIEKQNINIVNEKTYSLNGITNEIEQEKYLIQPQEEELKIKSMVEDLLYLTTKETNDEITLILIKALEEMLIEFEVGNEQFFEIININKGSELEYYLGTNEDLNYIKSITSENDDINQLLRQYISTKRLIEENITQNDVNVIKRAILINKATNEKLSNSLHMVNYFQFYENTDKEIDNLINDYFDEKGLEPDREVKLLIKEKIGGELSIGEYNSNDKLLILSKDNIPIFKEADNSILGGISVGIQNFFSVFTRGSRTEAWDVLLNVARKMDGGEDGIQVAFIKFVRSIVDNQTGFGVGRARGGNAYVHSNILGNMGDSFSGEGSIGIKFRNVSDIEQFPILDPNFINKLKSMNTNNTTAFTPEQFQEFLVSYYFVKKFVLEKINSSVPVNIRVTWGSSTKGFTQSDHTKLIEKIPGPGKSSLLSGGLHISFHQGNQQIPIYQLILENTWQKNALTIGKDLDFGLLAHPKDAKEAFIHKAQDKVYKIPHNQMNLLPSSLFNKSTRDLIDKDKFFIIENKNIKIQALRDLMSEYQAQMDLIKIYGDENFNQLQGYFGMLDELNKYYRGNAGETTALERITIQNAVDFLETVKIWSLKSLKPKDNIETVDEGVIKLLSNTKSEFIGVQLLADIQNLLYNKELRVIESNNWKNVLSDNVDYVPVVLNSRRILPNNEINQSPIIKKLNDNVMHKFNLINLIVDEELRAIANTHIDPNKTFKQFLAEKLFSVMKQSNKDILDGIEDRLKKDYSKDRIMLTDIVNDFRNRSIAETDNYSSVQRLIYAAATVDTTSAKLGGGHKYLLDYSIKHDQNSVNYIKSLIEDIIEGGEKIKQRIRSELAPLITKELNNIPLTPDEKIKYAQIRMVFAYHYDLNMIRVRGKSSGDILVKEIEDLEINQQREFLTGIAKQIEFTTTLRGQNGVEFDYKHYFTDQNDITKIENWLSTKTTQEAEEIRLSIKEAIVGPLDLDNARTMQHMDYVLLDITGNNTIHANPYGINLRKNLYSSPDNTKTLSATLVEAKSSDSNNSIIMKIKGIFRKMDPKTRLVPSDGQLDMLLGGTYPYWNIRAEKGTIITIETELLKIKTSKNPGIEGLNKDFKNLTYSFLFADGRLRTVMNIDLDTGSEILTIGRKSPNIYSFVERISNNIKKSVEDPTKEFKYRGKDSITGNYAELSYLNGNYKYNAQIISQDRFIEIFSHSFYNDLLIFSKWDVNLNDKLRILMNENPLSSINLSTNLTKEELENIKLLVEIHVPKEKQNFGELNLDYEYHWDYLLNKTTSQGVISFGKNEKKLSASLNQTENDTNYNELFKSDIYNKIIIPEVTELMDRHPMTLGGITIPSGENSIIETKNLDGTEIKKLFGESDLPKGANITISWKLEDKLERKNDIPLLGAEIGFYLYRGDGTPGEWVILLSDDLKGEPTHKTGTILYVNKPYFKNFYFEDVENLETRQMNELNQYSEDKNSPYYNPIRSDLYIGQFTNETIDFSSIAKKIFGTDNVKIGGMYAKSTIQMQN